MACQQPGLSLSHSRKHQLINFTLFADIDDAVNGRCTQSNQHSGSKDSRIRYDKSHLIFVIASNSFYLNPYDDITQGPENTPTKPFIPRMPTVRLLRTDVNWQVSSNSGITTLMVQPLSTKAQLLSPSILDPGYVFRSTSPSKQIGVIEETFWDIFRSWKSCLGCWLSDYWFLRGPPPFFVIPLLHLNSLFGAVLLRSFRQSFMRWSGLPHLKQFQFSSDTTWSCCKWTIYPTNWSAPPTLLKVPASSASEDSASSFSSFFISESSSASLLSTVVDQIVKVWLPFNFWEGNKFPDVWEWVTFDPPVVVVFSSRGSLASAHLSNFWAARSRSE